MAGWGLWTLAGLALHLHRTLTLRQKVILSLLLLGSLLTLVFEPGFRWFWWLD